MRSRSVARTRHDLHVRGSSLKGRLLVATPALGDPNFDRTVILLLEHSDEGALGVVLNRPTDIDVGDPLPGWDRLAGAPSVVFTGGPVAPDAVLCLAESSDDATPGLTTVADDIVLVDLNRDPDDLAGALTNVRVFAGYAGWGTSQLEDEIASGAWFVVDTVPGDAMSPDPGVLWQSVLRRQGGRLALFASYPERPWLN
jgi:putative transcriptional regulator